MAQDNFLPYSADIESGIEFRVIDFRDASVLSATVANAAGTMTATFEEVGPGYWWEIERLSVQSDSALASTVKIYAGDPGFKKNFRDSTVSGNLAVSDNASPIRLSAAQQLTVVWSGATPGATGWAWCQYKLVKRVVATRKG